MIYMNTIKLDAEYYANQINNLKVICGGLAAEAGWDSEPLDIPRSLMLTVSELSEAMEGHRKGLADDKLPHRRMFEVELADAMIRILHLADRAGCDLGGAMVEKLIYNTTREDHKAEVRAAKGGKAY